MTVPQTQRSTRAEVRVRHTASTQSTGEIRIPVSELWVWQHAEPRRVIRQARQEIEDGKLEDLSEYLRLHKND